MALVPTLTLNDTTTFSDKINFSVTDELTVKAPSLSLSTIIVDTTGANNIILPANDNKQTWLFVRHTGTTDGSSSATAHVDIELTGNVAIGTLKPNEWFWFPHCGNGGSTGIQLQSVSGAVQC